MAITERLILERIHGALMRAKISLDVAERYINRSKRANSVMHENINLTTDRTRRDLIDVEILIDEENKNGKY